MKTIRLRAVCRLTCLCITLALAVGCRRVETREDVIRSLARDVVAAQTLEVLHAMQALHTAASAAHDDGPLAADKRLQNAIARALTAVERASVVRRGPLVHQSTLLRAAFFPVRTSELAQRIADEPAPTEAMLDALGVDLKGIFAIEALVYAAPDSPLGKGAEPPVRQRAWLVALAANALKQAERADTELQSADHLAEAWGKEPTVVLSDVVTDMVAHTETLASERLNAPLSRFGQARLQASDLRGGPSGLSAQLVRESAEALFQAYGVAPNGVAGLVQRSAPAIALKIAEKIQEVRARMQHFDGGMETLLAMRASDVRAAADAMKTLEQTLKTDLVAALGLTLTFSSSDGD